MQILLYSAALFVSYLLGSLLGSMLLARFWAAGDIRNVGSGNAGATNAVRAGGVGFGLAVLAFDLTKGLAAVLGVPALTAATASQPIPTGLAYGCGAAVVVGHIFPLFYGFRGGKGAATMIGVLICLVPLALSVGAIIWAATLVLSGYVSLATLLGLLAVGLNVWLWLPGGLWTTPGLFMVVMSLLLFYTHWPNVQRLKAGTENRFEKAMLLHRSPKA